MEPKWLTVGRIVNTHGVRGEVKVWPETDFPGERFAKGSELLLVAPDDSAAVPVTVASARPQKAMYLIKFEEYDDINAVLPYKTWFLKVPADKRVPLAEDEYYFHDIIGCRVESEEGEPIGVVSEILRPGANDVWVVQRPRGKPVYVPFIADVVRSVDVASKKVTIRVLEGLLE